MNMWLRQLVIQLLKVWIEVLVIINYDEVIHTELYESAYNNGMYLFNKHTSNSHVWAW